MGKAIRLDYESGQSYIDLKEQKNIPGPGAYKGKFSEFTGAI